MKNYRFVPGKPIQFLALTFVFALLAGVSLGQKPNDAPSSIGKRPSTFQLVPLRTLPHDSTSFCQGLTVETDRETGRDVFYESAGGYGRSRLRLVDVETGKSLRETKLDDRFFAEGLAVVGSEIFQLTWREQTCLHYDKKSFQNLDFARYSCEGWGLTFDGTHLILSDGTDVLRFLDPKTFRTVRSVSVQTTDAAGKTRRLEKLNELEFIEGEVWANVYQTPYIVRIDPVTGKVVGSMNFKNYIPKDFQGDLDHVFNGIAWHPEKRLLYVTGKNWPVIYELTIKEVLTPPAVGESGTESAERGERGEKNGGIP